MQNIDFFYYPNAVEVQVNLDPTVFQRNRTVYQRTIKLYRGIDNTIRFTFKNSNQKPVNITGWDITFNMLDDESGTLLFQTDATVANANAGIATVLVSESDLTNKYDEFYNYGLVLTDQDTGQQQVVYADDNYDVRGELHLKDGPFPKFRNSINVSIPTDSNAGVYTSTIGTGSLSGQVIVHHTAQFYFDTFTGTIDVQTTLDSIPPNDTNGGNSSISWTTVTTLDYTDQSITDYYTWDGVFTGVRFEITPTSGNVTQILYRGIV